MTKANLSLDNFIKTASDLLATNEATLQQLSGQVEEYLNATPTAGSNGQFSPEAWHYLQGQVTLLHQQNQHLKTFLHNQCVDVLPNPILSRIQVLQQQEEERARTAKDLEDTMAQLLANTIFELAAVKQLLTTGHPAADLMTGINALQEELEAGLSQLRFLIAGLEPSSTLGSFGLIAGLRRYLEKFSEQTGLEVSYQPQALIEPLPNIVELAIFRIIQETLQNAYAHAHATHIGVSVTEAENQLQFKVQDNGIGLNFKLNFHKQRHLGLVGMKDLADLLAGKLQIISDPSQGTQVILTIPYPQY